MDNLDDVYKIKDISNLSSCNIPQFFNKGKKSYEWLKNGKYNSISPDFDGLEDDRLYMKIFTNSKSIDVKYINNWYIDGKLTNDISDELSKYGFGDKEKSIFIYAIKDCNSYGIRKSIFKSKKDSELLNDFKSMPDLVLSYSHSYYSNYHKVIVYFSSTVKLHICIGTKSINIYGVDAYEKLAYDLKEKLSLYFEESNLKMHFSLLKLDKYSDYYGGIL